MNRKLFLLLGGSEADSFIQLDEEEATWYVYALWPLHNSIQYHKTNLMINDSIKSLHLSSSAMHFLRGQPLNGEAGTWALFPSSTCLGLWLPTRWENGWEGKRFWSLMRNGADLILFATKKTCHEWSVGLQWRRILIQRERYLELDNFYA